jgi:hypothetical protein
MEIKLHIFLASVSDGYVFTLVTLPLAKIPPYPQDNRVHVSQSWSGYSSKKEKLLLLLGIEPQRSSLQSENFVTDIFCTYNFLKQIFLICLMRLL